MALPKRRHSITRGRKRRTHWKVTAPGLVTCLQCKKKKLPHRICPHCGYYKGKEVVAIQTVEERKREREKKREDRRKKNK